MSDVVRTPESKCLHCGSPLNALGTSDGSEADPQAGDAVVCLRCGAVMKLNADLTARGMSEQEMEELLADKEWADTIAQMVKRVYYVMQMRN